MAEERAIEEDEKQKVSAKIADIKNLVNDLFYTIPLDVSGGREARGLTDEITDMLDDISFKIGIETEEEG